MTLFESIILGVIQGATEFIPVSSSGHLAITSFLFDFSIAEESTTTIFVFLHVGTLLALLTYYRKKLVTLLHGVIHGHIQEQRLFLLLAVGSIPGFAFGALYSFVFEALLTGEILFLLSISALSGSGSIFIITSHLYKRTQAMVSMQELSWWRASIVGIAQAFGIISGVSRSGATITGARLMGMTKKDSLDFAFLLSIPIISGAAVYQGLTGFDTLLNTDILGVAIVGCVVSAIVGYGAIAWLLKYLRNNSLSLFGMYCISVSTVSFLIYLW